MKKQGLLKKAVKNDRSSTLQKGMYTIYISSGFYCMHKIYTNKEIITLSELAFICMKSGKGVFETVETYEVLLNANPWIEQEYSYIDLTRFGLSCYYMYIYGIRSNDVIIE